MMPAIMRNVIDLCTWRGGRGSRFLSHVDRKIVHGEIEPARRSGDFPAELHLVEQHIAGRQLGLLGEARVNVLELNLDLDKLAK